MKRIPLAFFFFLTFFLAIGVKLFDTQVLNHDQYAILAQAQQEITLTTKPERGKIYASGRVLATNEEAYLFFANPQKIEDAAEVAEKLTPLLLKDSRFTTYNSLSSDLAKKEKVDPTKPPSLLIARLTELLSNKKLQWVSLARKVPAAVVAEIRKLEMEGLGFTLDRRRFYPEGSLASSLLGFVAFNEEGLDRGYNGLEGSYDGDLRGNSGKMVATYSAYQDPILAGDFDTLAVQNGSDLYLTINRGVQSLLDKKLVEGVKRFGAKSGSYVVLESSTGKVLAMGNYPNFSPGNFNLFTSPKAARPTYPPTLRNAAISSSYEPGSVMKPVTIATALELGKIKPDWTFNDTGALKIDGATINTWDGRHWGKQTLSQLLQKSNNIGAARVAQAVGREGLRNSFNNFGFGSKLGVDLQGEEAGQVKDLINWRNVDLANAGFGQGVAVTTLQMASAYAAFANGGILMKPYVVEKIVDQDGRKVEFSPQPTRRVISQKTAAVVVELLRSAVEGGESIVLHNLPYRVAGKTGTAEIPEKGGYARDRTNTIFVGFPFKEKNFVMIFRLEEPRTSTFSATTVVPLWVEAFEEIAPLLGVLPSR